MNLLPDAFGCVRIDITMGIYSIHDVSLIIVSVERERVVGSQCPEDGHCALHITYLSSLP